MIKDSLSTTLHVSLHTFVYICYCLLEEIGLLICIKGDSKYFGYKVLQVNLSTIEKENSLFLTTTNMISNSSWPKSVMDTDKSLGFCFQFTWTGSFQKSVQTCKDHVVLFFKLRVSLMFSGWAHLCKMQNLVCPAVSHAVVKCAEARDKYDCK